MENRVWKHVYILERFAKSGSTFAHVHFLLVTPPFPKMDVTCFNYVNNTCFENVMFARTLHGEGVNTSIVGSMLVVFLSPKAAPVGDK